MSTKVGIVIVSHSPEVARGTANMVRQMVGNEVPLSFCGGNPEGGLGTNVEKIMAAIEAAWADRGVAILVDLGGALGPSAEALADNDDLSSLRQKAGVLARATVPMKAIRGRASFLADRSIGHMDPGARSSELMVEVVCDVLEGRA
jgi:dihydroxyacetone kinase DhaKLM complex PTS-EIIA-like component DhaM